eukprot:2551479-Pyramimonas_sp.AAC.1
MILASWGPLGAPGGLSGCLGRSRALSERPWPSWPKKHAKARRKTRKRPLPTLRPAFPPHLEPLP